MPRWQKRISVETKLSILPLILFLVVFLFGRLAEAGNSARVTSLTIMTQGELAFSVERRLSGCDNFVVKSCGTIKPETGLPVEPLTKYVHQEAMAVLANFQGCLQIRELMVKLLTEAISNKIRIRVSASACKVSSVTLEASGG